jgi:hypothetical protein
LEQDPTHSDPIVRFEPEWLIFHQPCLEMARKKGPPLPATPLIPAARSGLAGKVQLNNRQ